MCYIIYDSTVHLQINVLLLLCIHACTYISTVLNLIDKGSFIDMLKAGGGDGDGKTKKAKKAKVRHDCDDGTI